MKDEELLLLLFGLMAISGKGAADLGDGWVWPVASLRIPRGGTLYGPVISNEYGPGHLGVDVMFRRRSPGDRPEYAPGTPDGSPLFFAPPRTPILAARQGVIWSVQKTPKGWAVVIDHGRPFATFYAHLETPAFPLHARGVNVNTGQQTRVITGQPLGFMGYSPEDPERLRHLHFAVWKDGHGNGASVDPGPAMAKWQRSPLAFTP